MTCPYRHSDGAYVLGALGPAERAEFEEHLAGCARCTHAVQELAPLPGLLGRADPGAVPAVAPTSSESRVPTLLATIVQHRRRQARRQRWRLAAAATAMVAVTAAGTATVVSLSGDPSAPAPVAAATMTPVGGETVPVTARVRLTSAAAGTELWMECGYPDEVGEDYEPGARVFRLVTVANDGTEEQVGSWLAAPGDRVEMTGITRLDVADLARVEVRDAAGAAMLMHRP